MCGNILREKIYTSQNTYKKKHKLFLIPVKDVKIPEIFHKIQKFLRTTLASVIVHKVLLHLIIWI